MCSFTWTAHRLKISYNPSIAAKLGGYINIYKQLNNKKQ